MENSGGSEDGMVQGPSGYNSCSPGRNEAPTAQTPKEKDGLARVDRKERN